jgi:Caspase domain
LNDLHYAVVVGINRYPGIGDLTGARADARAFTTWLTKPDGGGLPTTNVKQICLTAQAEKAITSVEGARPTSQEIDDALMNVARAARESLNQDASLWERSRLYFYVAGHGLAPQGGEGALFLAHADNERLSRNLELAEYRRWCTTCAFFREVVVFADCCRTRYRKAVRGYGPQLDECDAPWEGKVPTYVIGYGSALGYLSYEDTQAGGVGDKARGYFTRALLDGLDGAAPRDSEGAITAATLSGYVQTVVAEQTANEQYPQEAQIIGELVDKVSFGSTAPPPTRKITIQLGPDFAGELSVVTDGRVVKRWDGQQRPWPVDLPDGLYELESPTVQFPNDGLFKVAGADRAVVV